jgi:SAM-dependent methyltransferase
MGTESELGTVGVGRRPVDGAQSARANRLWWDADAENYHAEHGAFLGTEDFVWCPEALREADAKLLGPTEKLAGASILEVGCGSAMCSRWLAGNGAHVTAFDISLGMLNHGRTAGPDIAVVQADAQRMPFRDNAFDIAFSAYGAVPFVAESAAVMAEVARVLRPAGRWVFSTTHPVRWCFADTPGEEGLTASMSYFDRNPYVEFDAHGQPTYVEHHRTLGDRIREIVAAGFRLVDVIEPEWPDELVSEWGGWSALRGRILPGTTIYVCELPAA